MPVTQEGTSPMTTEINAPQVDSDCECEGSRVCIRPLIRRAFGIFWDHALLLISAHLIVLLVLVAGNFVLTMMGGNLLLGPFLLGAYKIALRLARNQNTDLSDLLSGFEYFLPAFLANLLIQVLSILVFPLLFVPTLLVFLTYAATYLFILDEDLGFWDAMEKSRRMVWGNFRRWSAVGVVILGVNLAGLLCFGVGLLVTLPFTYVLVTLAYEEERAAQQKRAELEGAPALYGETASAQS